MFALLFPEPGHGAAQAVLPCSKTQKDRAANVEAKENRRMRALNKASHPAVVLRCLGVRYSVWLRKCVSIKETGLYRECNP